MTWTKENTPKRTANGSKWRRIVRAVVVRDCGICLVCGHGSATAGGHLLSVAEYPEKQWDVSNVFAIHHYNPRCPVCSAAAIAKGNPPPSCNMVMGYGSLERAQRLMRDRTGLPIGQPRVSSDTIEGDWW